MKRIKSIRQLRKERERLQQRQEELARKLGDDWDAILNAVRPANMLRESLNTGRYKEKTDSADQNSLRSVLFSVGTGILVKKLAGILRRKSKI